MFGVFEMNLDWIKEKQQEEEFERKMKQAQEEEAEFLTNEELILDELADAQRDAEKVIYDEPDESEVKQ